MPAMHQPLWQRLFEAGEWLRARGENLSSYRDLLALRDHVCWNHESIQISNLLFEADQEIQYWTCQLDAARSSGTNQQDIINFGFQLRTAELRMRDDIIGNRKAFYREAKLSNLSLAVHETIDEYEAKVAVLVEQRDNLEPEWLEIQAEFMRKLENGDLVRDPLLGLVDQNDLVSVGPPTNVDDISSHVESSSEIEGERCPICLGDFILTQDVVRLACGHLIDSECLDTWINSTAFQCNTCVACRAELFPRRRREPSDFMLRYQQMCFSFHSLDQEIHVLRSDSMKLAELLCELQPNAVAYSLGR